MIKHTDHHWHGPEYHSAFDACCECRLMRDPVSRIVFDPETGEEFGTDNTTS